MRLRGVIVAAVVVALAAVPAVAFGGSAGTAANSQTYNDSAGEDPAAPDIQQIVVSNDDAGLITFKIGTPNRPALTGDMLFLLFLDTVPNAGDPESLGADWALQLVPEGVALFKWNGADYLFADSQAGLGYQYTAGGPSITVSSAALGKPKTIGFVVLAIAGITFDANGDADFANAHADIAPGFGVFSYEVKATLVLTAIGATTSPKAARAGKPFSAAFAATRNDTGGFVEGGTVTCRAKIGGTPLAAKARRVANGIVACSWTIPASAKGKTISGSVSVSIDGATVSRAFASKIG